jgi:hypothetical protein
MSVTYEERIAAVIEATVTAELAPLHARLQELERHGEQNAAALSALVADAAALAALLKRVEALERRSGGHDVGR